MVFLSEFGFSVGLGLRIWIFSWSGSQNLDFQLLRVSEFGFSVAQGVRIAQNLDFQLVFGQNLDFQLAFLHFSLIFDKHWCHKVP